MGLSQAREEIDAWVRLYIIPIENPENIPTAEEVIELRTELKECENTILEIDDKLKRMGLDLALSSNEFPQANDQVDKEHGSRKSYRVHERRCKPRGVQPRRWPLSFSFIHYTLPGNQKQNSN